MKLSNKLLIIFLFFLLLILFYNINNVFANYDFKYNNVDYSLPDLPSYDTDKYNSYVIFYDTSKNLYYFVLQPVTGFTYFDFDNGYLIFYLNNDNSIPITVYTYNINDSFSWVEGSKSQDNTGGSYNRFNSDNTGSRYVVYSTLDIYNRDGSKCFFCLPVQEILIIPALEEVEELPKAIVTTMKIVTPVGLVLLGIILLIYLIKRVIYLSH